jgi:hypothetical protein
MRLWEVTYIAFEGIQPTFKQVPPKLPLFSTQAVYPEISDHTTHHNTLHLVHVEDAETHLKT